MCAGLSKIEDRTLPRPETQYVGHPPFPSTTTMFRADALVPPPQHRLFPFTAASQPTTIYVSGLPSDATERECGHLFRPYSGFLYLQLHTKSSSLHVGKAHTVLFVSFATFPEALRCIEHLNGYVFDPANCPHGIRMSIARSATRPQTVVIGLPKPLAEGARERESTSKEDEIARRDDNQE